MRKTVGLILIHWIAALSFVNAQTPAEPPRARISGLMFGDYYYNLRRDTAFAGTNTPPRTALSGAQDLNGFQFRRIYFTYDNDISSQFTTRFRLEADQAALSSDGKISNFVKDAFLRWKNVFQRSDLYFGIIPTPGFEISENSWGYRPLEKTIMDLRGIVSARDIGIALRGTFDSSGTFGYWAMIGNNSANKPESDKYKRYYLNFQLKPTTNLIATLYGDYRDQASVDDPLSTSTPKATVGHGILTTALFIGYSEPGQFNVGVEGFLSSTANDLQDPISSALKARKGMGVSLFGWVNLQSDISLVGRYDFYDPNTDGSSKGDIRNYFLGGLAWRPDKNVSIIPNAQIETYESLPGGQSVNPSVTGRITFAYVFL